MFILLKISNFPVSWFIICDIKPNPGRIKIYTSGWPKNQNKCWKIIGLPFPIGLKNIELKLWSIIIIVIPLANTGMDIISKIEVTIIDQQYRDKLLIIFLFEFIFVIEIKKFKDLMIDEIPFKWIDKITELIALIFWVDSGGYNVHPVKILFFVNILINRISRDGNKIHILILFNRGYIKSEEKIIIGINQFLNTPIIMGIVIKKIINNAWIVIII